MQAKWKVDRGCPEPKGGKIYYMKLILCLDRVPELLDRKTQGKQYDQHLWLIDSCIYHNR